MTIYSTTYPPLGYYVYAYLRSDGKPYYIGKGIRLRAWKHEKRERIHPPKNTQMIVICESNLTELGALALERRLIRIWGRKDLNEGVLQNRSDGGEGVSSGNRHPNYGKNLPNPNKGHTSIAGSIAKQGENNPMFGKKHKIKTKNLLQNKMIGRVWEKVTCEYCCKEVSVGNFKRWHGSECKSNK